MEGSPDFGRARALPLHPCSWTPDTDIRAQARILWGPDALHLKLSATERHIRALYVGRPHPVSEDSCLEFFFCPLPGDPRYFNFEFNPNAALYLGIGTGRHDLVRLLVQDEEALFRPRPFTFEGGWGITYRIPFSFVQSFFPGFSPAPGASLRCNFYKTGDKTPRPHYLSWSPVFGPVPDFHRPRDFGTLTFA